MAGEENYTLGFAFGTPFFLSLLILVSSNLTIYFALRRARLPDTNREAAIQRVQDVAHQATLYVFAAYSTSIGDMVVRSYEVSGAGREDESDFFWALLMGQILYPLQGFWNFIIFLRPQFLRFRRHKFYVNESCWWCFRNAIVSERVASPAIRTTAASTPPVDALCQESDQNTPPDTPTSLNITVATDRSRLSFFMSVFQARRDRLSPIAPEIDPGPTRHVVDNVVENDVEHVAQILDDKKNVIIEL